MWPPPRGRRAKWLIVNIKRTPDGRRQRSGKIIDEKREKYRAKNGSLQNTSKGATFVILINFASAPIRKERLRSTSKARSEANRALFVEKGWVPDRVESFGEVYSSEKMHQSTAASTWWCGPQPCLGWVEMAVGLPDGPSYFGQSLLTPNLVPLIKFIAVGGKNFFTSESFSEGILICMRYST